MRSRPAPDSRPVVRCIRIPSDVAFPDDRGNTLDVSKRLVQKIEDASAMERGEIDQLSMMFILLAWYRQRRAQGCDRSLVVETLARAEPFATLH